jgi:hypothetical protein
MPASGKCPREGRQFQIPSLLGTHQNGDRGSSLATTAARPDVPLAHSQSLFSLGPKCVPSVTMTTDDGGPAEQRKGVA